MRSYTLSQPQAQKPAPTDDTSDRLLGELLGELNEEQRAVACAGDGPVLVIAGAGSGKTRALVYRLAYLLARGVPADAILLLTFTNKAAKAMLARAAELTGIDPRKLNGGTFHHVGLSILRAYADKLGFQSTFTILDREDGKELMAACVTSANIDIKTRRFPAADVLQDLYSKAINTHRPIAQLIVDEYRQYEPLTQDILNVLKLYVQRKHVDNVMDFDDLLLQWRRLFVEHPEVSAFYADKYRYVLVDEYQDTNRLQGELCDLMSSKCGNLLVVGDDAQSIYGFRGAQRENILRFPEMHPGTQVLRLEANYRSTPQILRLANQTLERAQTGYKKTLRAMRQAGTLPALVTARDDAQQAAFVAQRILELRDEGIALQDIAVLYRAHFHAMELQIELSRRGIPFVVRSGVKFFESAHIKDVLAFLRALHNPKDELAFRRVLRLVPGVGQASADKLSAMLADPNTPEAALLAVLPAKAKAPFAAFFGLYRELYASATLRSTDVIDRFAQSFYLSYLEAAFTDAQNRQEDLQKLAEYSAQFHDVEGFLSEIALVSELTAEQLVKGGKSDEAVVLSSVHQAKGLEWRAVFVLWLSEGRFPSQNSVGFVEPEEEERRLFYVAVTRAKDELYLIAPLIAYDRQRRQVLVRPSRYVSELEALSDPAVEKWQLEEPSQLKLLGE